MNSPSGESGFALHPQLEQDTFFIADWDLCRVLLMDNALFPWLILVPRAGDAREIIDLSGADRHLLMDEISRASFLMQSLYGPDKLNVAALGNQVAQLHVHIVARFASDAAWPNPVWGARRETYPDGDAMVRRLQNAQV